MLMAATEELTAPDDRTILFRLRQPFPQLPDALGKATNNMAAIMPARLAATDPFKQVPELIGSGPFRFKADERVSGSQYVYERFADYVPRGRHARLDRRTEDRQFRSRRMACAA
jgi:peptide/nickel transport system substrate-binding protein